MVFRSAETKMGLPLGNAEGMSDARCTNVKAIFAVNELS